jgi:hypothetical protein
MKKVSIGNGGGVLTALALVCTLALALATCAPELDPESEVQYGENGERLVNLALNMGGGGGGRSIGPNSTRFYNNYNEVVFKQND